MTLILLHHLSDVHIGPLHYAAARKLSFAMPTECTRNLDLYIRHLEGLSPDKLPDLVIISGDLTSYAREAEMNLVQDRLEKIVAEIKRKKESLLRISNPAPYLLIVPGNHDLDWSKTDFAGKIERYARMATALSMDGTVVSSQYWNKEAPVCWDFGDDSNLFVYLLTTTSLGGVRNPVLENVAELLAGTYKKLHNEHVSAEQFSLALAELEEQTRNDPGFLARADLDALTARVNGGVKPSRFKIAVMHHNLSSVATDDLERFDTIINAGFAKQVLSEAGFDMVLHGHRHILSCSHESMLRRGGGNVGQGLFIVSGDSLGSSTTASFTEIRLQDSDRVHSSTAPAALVSVHLFTHQGTSYSEDRRPDFEQPLTRPRYSDVETVLKYMGRTVPAERQRDVLRATESILNDLQQLKATLVDWAVGSGEWIVKFHFQLQEYRKIYATDSAPRSAVGNPIFGVYLREQYLARLERCLASPSKVLTFSKPVYDAIIRTGWKPNPILWKDYEIRLAKADEPSSGLEVVRILIRPEPTFRDVFDLQNLDHDHRLFAIPLFVLRPAQLAPEQALDFAIGLDNANHVIRCYEFMPEHAKVDEAKDTRGQTLTQRFEKMLAHKDLKTVPQFQSYGQMFKTPAQLSAFAGQYDKTRCASPAVLAVLRKHLNPQKDKIGVEIGCGTGNYTFPLAEALHKVVAFDISEQMLGIARLKNQPVQPKIEWRCGDAATTHLPDDYCDCAWSISTLHYFDASERMRLFREMARILKEGGVMVFDTLFAEQFSSLWIVEFFPTMYFRFHDGCIRSDAFIDELKRAGFSKITTESIEYYPDQGDGILQIGQHQPDLYQDDKLRGGMPVFKHIPEKELLQGLERLNTSIQNGSINEIIAKHYKEATMPGDIGFVIATR